MKISLTAKAAALVAISLASFSASAAVISSRDFNALTIGNLGTDVTGVTPGQDGWLTFGGTNASYQIVNDPVAGGTRGRNLRVTGPSSTSTATRFAWNDDVANGWNVVTDQEIVIIWDQYVAAPTTLQTNATNRGGIRLFDTTGARTLVGMQIQANTGALSIISYFDPADGTNPVGNYFFNLGPGGAELPVARNTWHTFAMTWNKVTGRSELFWSIDGVPGFEAGVFVDGASAGSNPIEYDALITRNAATQGTNFHFDNISAETFIPEPAAMSLLALPAMAMLRRRK